MLRVVVTFCGSPRSSLGRRSETAWQPQRLPRCSREGQQKSTRRSGGHASQSRIVDGQCSGCWESRRLCCRSCAVLSPGSPCNVGRCRPAEKSSVQQQQGRIGRGIAISGPRNGLPVERGRRVRWSWIQEREGGRRAGLASSSLVQTADGYDAERPSNNTRVSEEQACNYDM